MLNRVSWLPFRIYLIKLNMAWLYTKHFWFLRKTQNQIFITFILPYYTQAYSEIAEAIAWKCASEIQRLLLKNGGLWLRLIMFLSLVWGESKNTSVLNAHMP